MMKSAKKSRQDTLSVLSNDNRQVTEAIDKEIREAICSGYMYCYINSQVPPEIRSELLDLGYQVTNLSNQKNGDTFKLEW